MEEKASLHLYSVYIGSPSEGSVQVELGIHPDCLGRILAVLDPQFLQSHHLSVDLGQEKLAMLMNNPQWMLNHHVLSSSGSGDLMTVTFLLNSGVNVQTADSDNQTPLYKACKQGHLQMVYLLTGRGSMVDSRDHEGYTPLMIAAGKGHHKIVIELLSLGADVNAQSHGGWSALIMAASMGHTNIVIDLVKAGANLYQPTIAVENNCDMGTGDDMCKLHLGEKIMRYQQENGRTALMEAVNRDKTDTVIQLVKLGADIDLQDYEYEESALMIATNFGYTDTVIQLVKLGANLNLQNERGDSAVIKAIISSWSKPGVLKELVRGRSDLNLQNQEGLTGLMIATRNERAELIDILLEGDGINLDIQQDDTGWSALFFAAESKNTAITQALIKAGANQYLKDNNGLTPLDIVDSNIDDDCQLLTEGSVAPPCNPDNHAQDQDTSPSLKDNPAPKQGISSSLKDDPAPKQGISPSLEDNPAPDHDTALSQQNVLHITSGQRRQRRNLSETMRNLVNRSRRIAVEIFNQLNRRLKSSDLKEQSIIEEIEHS